MHPVLSEHTEQLPLHSVLFFMHVGVHKAAIFVGAPPPHRLHSDASETQLEFCAVLFRDVQKMQL